MAEYITRVRAQKIAGCTKTEMRKLLQDGVIASSRTETGAWLVDKDSLLQYTLTKNSEQGRGREESMKDIIVRLQRENSYLKALIDNHQISYRLDNLDYIPTLEELDLPPRVIKALKRHKVDSVDLLTECSETDLLEMPGIGRMAIKDIIAALAKFDLELFAKE